MARGLGINKRGFANSAVTRSQTSPISAAELSDTVSLYLPFDSDVNDDSDNNLTVTAGGGAAISSTRSKFGGYSLNLDGTDDYLSVAASTDFDFGTSLFTIEGWIYSEKPQSDNLYSQGIIYSGTTGHWSVSLGHLAPNNIRDKHTIQFYRYGTGDDQSYNVQTAQTVSRNAWHHFAVVRESPTTIKIYVDGVLSATEDSITPSHEFNSGGNAIEIGRNLGTTNSAHFVNGYIDDLRISKGIARYTQDFILPSQAVGAKLTGSNETNTTSASLYLPFDSDLNDDSDSNHTVTATGDVTISSAQAKFGGYSAYFDGNGDGLTIPSSTDFDFGSGDFTIEAWVYLNNISHTHHIVSWQSGSGATNTNWMLQVVGTSYVFNASDGSSYIVSSLSSGGDASSGVWKHIAVVRRGDTFIFFVNGSRRVSTTASGTIASTSRNLNIGLDPSSSSNRLDGYIDDLRIIKGHAKYTADFPVPTSAAGTSVSETVNDLTVLYLPFDSDTKFQDQARGQCINTLGGSLNLSTSVKKFGTASLYIDSSSDYIRYNHDESLNFGTNDFTVEAWFYVADDSSVGRWLGKSDVSTGEPYGWFIVSQTNNKWGFNAGSGTSVESWDIANNADLGTLTLNTWTHLAVTREGNTFRLFNNGSLITTFTSSLSMTTGDQPFGVGRQVGNNSNGVGYIDDIRVINGHALYTEAFTPPTSAVGLAVESGGVTSNIVDNKFLSSVWSLKDQNKKISKGEWIRNDANSGSDAKGVTIIGANIETTGHRWYQPPAIEQPFFNPSLLQSSSTLSNLNKTITNNSGGGLGANYILNSVTSGKYYIELTFDSNQDASLTVGVVNANHGAGTEFRNQNDSDAFGRRFGTDGPESADNINDGDTIGLALDADSSNLDIYVNNTLQSNMSGSFSVTGALFFAVELWDRNAVTLVDVDSYTYTAPSGYVTGWVE